MINLKSCLSTARHHFWFKDVILYLQKWHTWDVSCADVTARADARFKDSDVQVWTEEIY